MLAASWFYLATTLICGVVAMSIGSSWTTASTIGVGLVGISTMLGVWPAIAAGAVISGAYLGDKLSPLSDTTILTAQMVKADLMTHIKAQAWTSIPAFISGAALFTILGLVRAPRGTSSRPLSSWPRSIRCSTSPRSTCFHWPC